ncbi:hypothetical protein G7046_g2744 [Stylonectria norvegica]|nr:hypothetical protein G7046_g2744 [Stylonectria norvegica]
MSRSEASKPVGTRKQHQWNGYQPPRFSDLQTSASLGPSRHSSESSSLSWAQEVLASHSGPANNQHSTGGAVGEHAGIQPSDSLSSTHRSLHTARPSKQHTGPPSWTNVQTRPHQDAACEPSPQPRSFLSTTEALQEMDKKRQAKASKFDSLVERADHLRSRSTLLVNKPPTTQHGKGYTYCTDLQAPKELIKPTQPETLQRVQESPTLIRFIEHPRPELRSNLGPTWSASQSQLWQERLAKKAADKQRQEDDALIRTLSQCNKARVRSSERPSVVAVGASSVIRHDAARRENREHGRGLADQRGPEPSRQNNHVGDPKPHKRQYFDLPNKINASERPFWSLVFESLPHSIRSAINGDIDLKERVHSCCRFRRQFLWNGTLRPPRIPFRELDKAIDRWNEVYAARFYQVHHKMLARGAWSAVKDEMTQHVHSELKSLIIEMLEKQTQELRDASRVPLLKPSSNLQEFGEYLECLKKLTAAGGQNSPNKQGTESLISVVLQLMPNLEEALLKAMGVEDRYIGNHEDSSELNLRRTPTANSRSLPLDSQGLQILRSIEDRTPETSMHALGQHQACDRAAQPASNSKARGKLVSVDQNGKPSARKRKTTPAMQRGAREATTKRPRTRSSNIDSPGSTTSHGSLPSASKLALKACGVSRLTQGVVDDGSSTRDSNLRQSSSSSTGPEQTGKVLKPAVVRPATDGDVFLTPKRLQKSKSQKRSHSRKKKRYLEAKSGKLPSAKRASRQPSVSHQVMSPELGEPWRAAASNDCDEGREEVERCFRDGTASFEAMSPDARVNMMFRAVRVLMKDER